MKQSITQATTAYLTTHCNVDLRDLAAGTADLSNLTFSSSGVDMSNYGWVTIGKATISVEIDLDIDQLVAKKVDVIKDQIQQVYAAAEMKVKEFKEEISKLQSISYTASEPDSVSEHAIHISEIDAGVYTDVVIKNAKE